MTKRTRLFEARKERTVRSRLTTLRQALRTPRRDPVFVFGNQKSGTTAIANLLALASGASYSHDMLFRNGCRSLAPIYSGDFKFRHIRKRLRHEFACKVIKDPDFTLLMDEIREEVPAAKAVFVIREPASNIRSILSRLGIRGDKPKLDEHDESILDALPMWRDVLHLSAVEETGGSKPSYIEILARRWEAMARLYLKHQTWAQIIRYEDFCEDKKNQITRLSLRVGLQPNVDVSSAVDQPFQPRGSHQDFLSFFGEENLSKIDGICDQTASLFAYGRQGLVAERGDFKRVKCEGDHDGRGQ